MGTIKSKFSPSVNIERDQSKDFTYIVTSNARQIYDQLVRNRNSGIHSFSIIGSYGTGKSSFLIALKKHFQDKNTQFFEPLNGHFADVSNFQFDFIVGKYGSLIGHLSQYFDLGDVASEDDILAWVKQNHENLKKNKTFWFLVIDEFGKHLEYAAKENPEKELYFVQLLSEFANEQEKNFYFITSLHQAFDSYANGLSLQQRKEWDKVRGRLKELTFNEPVEQLLYIASKYLSYGIKNGNQVSLEQLIRIIEAARAFPLKYELDLELAQSLYPLDPLSAATLAIALQKYGQNERSLFTFLQSEEYLGLHNYDKDIHPFYNLSCVYDYLLHNYHHFLSSKYNPHYIQWSALKKALQRVETGLQEEIATAKSIVKTIGLLNIFAVEGAKINLDFLRQYSAISMGIDNVDGVISLLEKKQILRYRSYKQQFILFEGTDFDIEFELQNVTNKVDPVTNVVTQIKKHFNLPFLPAKRIYYKQGSPRFFEFKFSNEPLTESPDQPIDGYINLVFDTDTETVQTKSKDLEAPILYGVFKNTGQIEEDLFRIKQIKHVLEEVVDSTDKVARRELQNMLQFQISELNDTVLKNIYTGKGDIDWVFNGEKRSISDARSLNNFLSEICTTIYSKTPKFKNELINKENVSPAIYRPRKELLKRLIDSPEKEDLGFPQDTFPAEKTIYLSLLKETGFHKEVEGLWKLGNPEKNKGFDDLWKASEEFFESTKTGKRSITDFIEGLEKPPFGLKKGLIELWVPIYLIIKKDDFALFQKEAYVTELNYEIINLVYRNPGLFEIKAFHISEVKKKLFARYRAMLEQDESVEFTNETFVETVKPFLLIYNDLNEYGRNTDRISVPAQQLRDAIKSATDPEQAFFDQFVTALGYTDLNDLESDKAIQQFVYDLDKCIDEIKYSYPRLIKRIEECLLESLYLEAKEYEGYKGIIESRYESLNVYKLIPHQKKLLGRLLSNQPGRKEWIEAVAFAILDKPLSKLEDEEEPMLMERLKRRIDELDNLQELNKLNVDPGSEEAFKFRLQQFNRESLDRSFKVKKKQIHNAATKIEKLRKLLTGDKDLNTALLLKLIEEQQNHE